MGEYLLDDKQSNDFFKQAYELKEDESNSLNYAESLVCIGNPTEALEIASEVLKSQTLDLPFFFNANLIKIWSFFLTGDETKGLDVVKSIVGLIPKDFYKQNNWIYNKIAMVINKSDLQNHIKNMLLDLILLVSTEKDPEEFRKKYLN